jgi:hypothetical protein
MSYWNNKDCPQTDIDFWNNVQFGGGIGLGFGAGYTDISFSLSIYNFNEYVALGLGAQYTYVQQRNFLQLIYMEAGIII